MSLFCAYLVIAQKAVASFSPAVVTERILPVVIKGCKDSIINGKHALLMLFEVFRSFGDSIMCCCLC